MEELNSSNDAFAQSLILLQSEETLHNPSKVLAIVRQRLKAFCCYLVQYDAEKGITFVNEGYSSWSGAVLRRGRMVSDMSVKQPLIDRLKRDTITVYTDEDLGVIRKSYSRYGGADFMPRVSVLMAIPIDVGGKYWGNLNIVYTESRVLNAHEQDFFIRCGALLGTALDRHFDYLSLQDALEKSREAEKAEARFFSTVSHDIRTPLNAIIGFSDLMKQDASISSTGAQALAGIVASSQSLLQLISDVLDIAKIEAGRMEINPKPVDCKAVIKDAFANFKEEAAEKGLEFKIEADDLPIVEVDELRLRQVAVNLIGNAVKFTEHGCVTVRLAFEQPDVLVLVVDDTGVGIAAEDQRRIVAPFVQLNKHAKKGAGLGLPICKHLVDYMGGTLTIESAPGKGSTFTVRVPNIRIASGYAEVKSCSAAAVVKDISSLRVLAVDDVPMNVSVLKAMLKRLGVGQVSSASNGAEALNMLEENPGGFDMVLTDLWMPELDGAGLVREIRRNEALAGLTVYAITADVDSKAGCADAGFDEIIFKPLTIKKLSTLLPQA